MDYCAGSLVAIRFGCFREFILFY